MDYFHYSQNFIWSPLSEIGSGRTGRVFRGMHKETGHPVAVKTFHIHGRLSHRVRQEAESELLFKEFDALKKLNHENIVKLLAVEEEKSTRKGILIMELGTEGSLMSILEKHQNASGLGETEYLWALEDIANGTEYLRSHNIVHRDLKPGNIVQFLRSNGRPINKFIDFGAARVLKDEEEYMSFHGTEAYLHPDVYENYFAAHIDVNDPVPLAFKANFELWIIGATLYHLATGSIPFKPLHGNKKTMHRMITTKAVGVISATEHTSGKIEYSKELPKTCPLSPGLKKLVTVLLAGMMERDTSKMWSFRMFFDYVKMIMCQRVIHVLYVNEAKESTLYLPSNGKLKDVQNEIYEQFHLSNSNQRLYYCGSDLKSLVNASTAICHYPVTSPSQPLVLFSTCPEANFQWETSFLSIDDLPQAMYKDRDSELACRNCRYGYILERDIQSIFRSITTLKNLPCIVNAPDINPSFLCVHSLLERKSHIAKRVLMLKKCLFLISEAVKQCPLECDLSSFNKNVEMFTMKDKEINIQFMKLEPLREFLRQIDKLEPIWKRLSKDLKIPQCCVEDSKLYVNNNEICWLKMLKVENLQDRSRALEKILKNVESLGNTRIELLKLYRNILTMFTEWHGKLENTNTLLNVIHVALHPREELPLSSVLDIHSEFITQVEDEVLTVMSMITKCLENKNETSLVEIISIPKKDDDVPLKQLNETMLNEFYTKIKDMLPSNQSLLTCLLQENEFIIKKLQEVNEDMKNKFSETQIHNESGNAKHSN